jgi:hypothetical protein
MSRSAEEIHAANCFHVWRQGWRDGAQRRMVSSVATGHSDPQLAATYHKNYTKNTKVYFRIYQPKLNNPCHKEKQQ